VAQPETELIWRICPFGQTWSSAACSCEGEPSQIPWDPDDEAVCAPPWRYPTRQEWVDLLGDCEANVLLDGNGYCDYCGESPVCSEMFPSDAQQGAWYWTANHYGTGTAWYVDTNSGWVGIQSQESACRVRCVR